MYNAGEIIDFMAVFPLHTLFIDKTHHSPYPFHREIFSVELMNLKDDFKVVFCL